jgi:hypothetical protein
MSDKLTAERLALAKWLIRFADQGDMGRKPDPNSRLRKASAAILAMTEERDQLESELRITAWNEATSRGMAQDDAIAHVKKVVARALGKGQA